MKKNIKRTLATLMTLVMLLTAIPFSGIDFGAILAPKASATDISLYSVGDTITFGSYPQNKVTNSVTIAALNSISKNWVSYGYYSGTGSWFDGQMKPSDYMKYCDISYNGNKYRAVTFSSYRPYYTGGISSESNSVQDDNGYYIDNVYYFRFDPLTWRVLDPSEGFVMCTMAIDAQPYNNYVLYYYSDDEELYGNSSKTYYASDWANSSLRAWLNDDFYNTAFNSIEKAHISTTYNENKSIRSRKYDSDNTSDEIFLLSYNEVLNSEYEFSSSDSIDDTARRIKSTEYANCQGCEKPSNTSDYKNSVWSLRSPVDSHSVGFVDHVGYAFDNGDVGSSLFGIVPAFKFNPQSTICSGHSYESAVTLQPTCTTDGERKYTCTKCSDSYTEKIDKLGHSFGAYTVTTSATCTAKGVETRNCSRCTATETQEVAAKGHKYTATVTNPTCTASGFTTYKCSECTDSYVSDYKSATGHNFSAVTTRPTCTQSGYTTYTCTCGESYTSNYISATGHNYKTIVTAPTCSQSGYTTHKCQSCESSYVDSYVSAKGHTDGDWKVTKPATATAEGVKTLYCADCHIALRTESVPKLDPQPEKGKVKSVDIKDVTIEYKESAVIKPTIVADNGVKYDVDFKSSDTKFVTVDKNGKIYGAKKGSAKVTCTVTDEFGNVVKDTCTVTVKYSALQWFIEIALFGWIWY